MQIQRALSEVMNDQVLPRLQASLRSQTGQGPQQERTVPLERSKRKSKSAFNRHVNNRLRDELPHCWNFDEERDEAHYNCVSLRRRCTSP